MDAYREAGFYANGNRLSGLGYREGKVVVEYCFADGWQATSSTPNWISSSKKPADITVLRVTKIDFVINLQAAMAFDI